MCRKNLSYLVFLWKDAFKILWVFFFFWNVIGPTTSKAKTVITLIMRIVRRPANNAIYAIVFINVFTKETEKVKKKQRQDGHFLFIFILYKKNMILSNSDEMAVLINAEAFRQNMYVPCCNTKIRRIIFCIYGAEATACIHCYAFLIHFNPKLAVRFQNILKRK